MNHWMQRDTIRHHNLSILAAHPPGPRSKDAFLRFLGNFNPVQRQVYTRGQHYTITQRSVAQALRCGMVLLSDGRTCKDYIKEFTIKASIWELEESLYLLSQAKWMGKKDKFQAALSCPGHKCPYKSWVKFLKMRIQPNMTTTFQVREMVMLSRIQ